VQRKDYAFRLHAPAAAEEVLMDPLTIDLLLTILLSAIAILATGLAIAVLPWGSTDQG
jgi:hypothetical protein